MSPVPAGLAVGDLVLLTALLLPLGLGLLRATEWLLGQRFPLLGVERLLLALYASGGLVFVLASLGLPIFGSPLLVGLAAAGAAVLAVIWTRERGRSARPFLRWLASGPALIVVAGTLGLLAIEMYGVASFQFGNSYDGATHGLWVTVLIRSDGIPWTTQPFADVGITYPQGAPVWESMPALLFGWPISQTVVFLPTLFFALSVPAAYVLGVRWSDRLGPAAERTGAMFAAFFAVVAALPRLFLGGSFDVVLAFPLFLLIVAWLPSYVRPSDQPWRGVVAYGLAIGVAASLSWMIALEILILVASFEIARGGGRGRVAGALARAAILVGFVVAFLGRSLVGTVLWSGYPGRVLSPVGSPPYAPVPAGSALSIGYLTMELDPFSLFKPRLSPIPWMSLLIAALLAAGMVILFVGFALRKSEWRAGVPDRLARSVTIASVSTFVVVAMLAVAGAPASPIPSVTTLTNVDELSVFLFTFLGVIAIVPLLSCRYILEQAWSARSTDTGPAAPPGRRRGRRPSSGAIRATSVGVAVVVLAATFGGGAVSTGLDLPSYISGHIASIANVTAGDVSALEWSGRNLPACARVFVAPGSAAQYLPEYAVVHVVFPAFPAVYNLSYVDALTALLAGDYNGSVRADLLFLSIDAVFVTGQTTVQFPPLDPAGIEASPDFQVAFADGDATIFAFGPGEAASSCPIVPGT